LVGIKYVIPSMSNGGADVESRESPIFGGSPREFALECATLWCEETEETDARFPQRAIRHPPSIPIQSPVEKWAG
jgi:hypothetical protein